MSRGHNKNKGFSQTSKKFDGDLKEQHQKKRVAQHSSETGRHTEDDKAPKKAPSARVTQTT
jgi:hypothetical protein